MHITRRAATWISLGALIMTFLPTAWAQETVHRFAFPASARLNYDVDAKVSSTFSAEAELSWVRDGDKYTSQLAVGKFGLNLQVWTSKGALTPRGLEPARFDSKRLRGDGINALFARDQGKVLFSAGTPDAPLQAGAQDQLSVFMQLASLLAGEPTRWTQGKSVSFQAIGDRYAENWTFTFGEQENIKVPGGEFPAIKLTHEPTAERSQKLELWYAPSLGFIPIRIRITEGNSDYLDLRWADSQKP